MPMKSGTRAVFVSLLLAVCVLLPAGGFSAPWSFRFADDLVPRHCQSAISPSVGKLEFCILTDGDGNGVAPAVYALSDNGERREVWRDRDRGFHPWKLEIAELDGDPEPEIALGVYKSTRRDPELRKRVFVYDWTGDCLFAKWLGSRLTWPLEDFHFARFSPDHPVEHLFTIENDGTEKKIREYEWNDFGFQSVDVRNPLNLESIAAGQDHALDTAGGKK